MIMTVTPGMTAPAWSRTSPDICAESNCATAENAHAMAKQTANANLRENVATSFIISSPIECFLSCAGLYISFNSRQLPPLRVPFQPSNLSYGGLFGRVVECSALTVRVEEL